MQGGKAGKRGRGRGEEESATRDTENESISIPCIAMTAMYRNDGGGGGDGISIFRYGIPPHSSCGPESQRTPSRGTPGGTVPSQTVPAKGPPPQVEGWPLDACEAKPTIGGSWDGRDGSLIYVRPRTLHNHLELVTRGPRPRRAVKIRKGKTRSTRGRRSTRAQSPGKSSCARLSW